MRKKSNMVIFFYFYFFISGNEERMAKFFMNTRKVKSESWCKVKKNKKQTENQNLEEINLKRIKIIAYCVAFKWERCVFPLAFSEAENERNDMRKKSPNSFSSYISHPNTISKLSIWTYMYLWFLFVLLVMFCFLLKR